MSPDKLKHMLAAHFQVVRDRSTSDEIHIICPVPGCPDKTGNRAINVRTLYTNCWRCNDRQPHHVSTLFKIVGLEWEGTHALDADQIEEILRGTVEKPLTPVQEVPLPEGFQKLSENRRSCYWKFCKRMAEDKRLGIEDLEEAGAGFTRTGFWEPYCIFPVYEGPRMVYYQGRTYTDDGFETTKRFPSKQDVPYGANYWVHGLDELSNPKIRLVVLVESILNRLSLKRKFAELAREDTAVVCIFTHFFSRPQVAKLLRYSHVAEWCYLFDSDSTAIAHKKAIVTGCQITSTVAEMPHGLNQDGTERKTNDANDDVETALKAIDNRSEPKPAEVILSTMKQREIPDYFNL